VKKTSNILSLDDKPSNTIVNTNTSRRDKVREVFNMPLEENIEELNENIPPDDN